MAVRPLVGIVAAAGSGERLGASGPKAFVPCGGRPLLDWSLEALAAVCDRVVVVVPPGFEAGSDRVGGGASRSESVSAGLRSAPEAEVCVIHDAARPLVTPGLIRRCVAAVERGWDGAVAAAPVIDTVKEAAEDGRVTRTLDRSSLWSVQTPQAFRAEVLRRALAVPREQLAAATDDASLVEGTGGSVTVIDAPPENIKVTRPSDLVTVQSLLRSPSGSRVD